MTGIARAPLMTTQSRIYIFDWMLHFVITGCVWFKCQNLFICQGICGLILPGLGVIDMDTLGFEAEKLFRNSFDSVKDKVNSRNQVTQPFLISVLCYG